MKSFSLILLAALLHAPWTLAKQIPAPPIEGRMSYHTYNPDGRQIFLLEEMQKRAREFGWKVELTPSNGYGYSSYELKEGDNWQTLAEEAVRRGGCKSPDDQCIMDLKWRNQSLEFERTPANVWRRSATIPCTSTGYLIKIYGQDDYKVDQVGQHFTVHTLSRRFANFVSEYNGLEMRLPQTGQYCREGDSFCDDVAVYIRD